MMTSIGPWWRFDERMPPFDVPLLVVRDSGTAPVMGVVSIGKQSFGGPSLTILDPALASRVIFAWCDISELWGLIPPLGLSTQAKLDLVRDQAYRDWHATAKELISVQLTENIDYENLPIRPREERLKEVQRFRAAQGLPPLELEAPKTPEPPPALEHQGENVVPFKKP